LDIFPVAFVAYQRLGTPFQCIFQACQDRFTIMPIFDRYLLHHLFTDHATISHDTDVADVESVLDPNSSYVLPSSGRFRFLGFSSAPINLGVVQGYALGLFTCASKPRKRTCRAGSTDCFCRYAKNVR